MLDMDWRVWASLALIVIIFYFLFVPPKGKRVEKFEQLKRQKLHAEKNKSRPMTYPTLIVNGITARRGDSTILVMNDFSSTKVTFDGISQGHYSETVYLVVTGDGELKQHSAETSAQSDYKKGDYGIMALTMSPGAITQRNIVPEIIHKDNAFDLEFSVRVSAK